MRHRMWPVYAKAIHSAIGDRLTKSETELLYVILGRLIE